MPVPHEGITDFWLQYWELATEEVPSLRMQRPAVRGGRSTWIHFRDALQRRPSLAPVVLVHKLEKGQVQLVFPGWGGRMELLARAIRDTGSDFEVWPAQKSAAVAILVPAVDPAGNFSDQVAGVRTGLAAAVRLQEWWSLYWRNVLELVAAEVS